MSDPLYLNLTGRVIMVASRFAITEPRRITLLVDAVMAAIRHVHPRERPSPLAMQTLISEQLAMLEKALQTVRATPPGPDGGGVDPPPERPVPRPTGREQGQAAQQPGQAARVEAQSARAGRRRSRPPGSPDRATARSMEQKLEEERKPVQKLLTEECVHIGLVDKKQAAGLVSSMVGKRPEDAERAIVEKLRQVLQDQVKWAIRRHKGGPWASPLAQEEMRKDIHSIRSVKGAVMMARQVVKELRAWEDAHGRGGGILGLFVGRASLFR